MSLLHDDYRYKEHHVHQGIVADVSPLRYEPLAPAPAPAPGAVWVVLCSVRDPGNLGAIVRTCHYLGVARLVVAGARCQVSCDWWRAGHVTAVLTSDWSAEHRGEQDKLGHAGAGDGVLGAEPRRAAAEAGGGRVPGPGRGHPGLS